MLERAKSSILPNGNYREFFSLAGGNFAFSKREFPVIQINVASLSAYCVRACKIKHFTERELSGFFSLGGGGICVLKTRIPCVSAGEVITFIRIFAGDHPQRGR